MTIKSWAALFLAIVAFAYVFYDARKHPARVILLRDTTWLRIGGVTVSSLKRVWIEWDAASRRNRRLWLRTGSGVGIMAFDITSYFDDLSAALRSLAAFCRHPSDDGIEIRLSHERSKTLTLAGSLKNSELRCSVQIGGSHRFIDPALLDDAAREVEAAFKEYRSSGVSKA